MKRLIFVLIIGFSATGCKSSDSGDATTDNPPQAVDNTDNSSVDYPPVAQNGSATMLEDQVYQGALTGSDPDGSPVTYMVRSLPQHGNLTMNNNDGSFTYTPDENYVGQDSIGFSTNDGTQESTIAYFTVTVTPVNDAPTAVGQTVSTTMGVPTRITLSGSDIEGNNLSFSIKTQPTSGTLSGSGQFRTFVPAPGFIGQTQFVFTVSDGQAQADATVTVNILPPPAGTRDTTYMRHSSLIDGPSAVAFQGDRLLVARHWRIYRYLENGDIDPNFEIYAPFSLGSIKYIHVQQDGKILVAGIEYTSYATGYANERVRVVRFLANGAPDETFNGILLDRYASTTSRSELNPTLDLQSDGKIIILVRGNRSGRIFYSLSRYMTNGEIDVSFNNPGFGDNGFVETGNGGNMYPHKVKVLPDNKIVALGTMIVRFNSNGAYDPNFTSYFSNYYYFNDAVGLSNGKLLATGPGGTVKLNYNGTVDTSFGTAGIIYGRGSAISVDSQGRLLLATCHTEYSSGVPFRVFRTLADGSPDVSFGTSDSSAVGFTQISNLDTSIGDDVYCGPMAMKTQTNGRLVVVTGLGRRPYMGLLRLQTFVSRIWQ